MDALIKATLEDDRANGERRDSLENTRLEVRRQTEQADVRSEVPLAIGVRLQ